MDFAFWLPLLGKMAVTGATVVAASFVAIRSGPLVGAMVATLPISAGPAYVFLGLDHGPAFVADSAVASLVTNAITVVFALIYAALAQRHGVLPSVTAAMGAWLTLSALAPLVPWTFWSAGLLSVFTFAVCLPFARRFRDARMPPARRRWYDIPLRALMVALLIGFIVGLSAVLGPYGSGVLAVFPIVLTSLMLILQPRVGGPATAAVIANSISGLVGFGLALAALHLAAEPLGLAASLSLALAICIAWNLLVLAGRRRGIPI